MTSMIQPIANEDDRKWCAQLMSSNEPWVTLKRDCAACYALLGNAAKERYVIYDGTTRAGVLILDLLGPFPGYIQSICVAADARGRGIGTRAIAWAEDRIFGESPNVFICASSFNPDAQRLYERLGYEVVGVLKGFVVDEHDEALLRKRRGS